MATNVFELVCYNRYRQARLVLEAGGDPNFKNEIGETPLMACAMFIKDQPRRVQLIRMLLGFGADVNAQNDKGQTLLMYACILDQGDTLLLLLDKVDVDLNLFDISGNTCLMYACALDRAALVYVLLDGYQSGRLSVNIYHRNHEGHSAREIADQRNLVHISDLFTDTVDKDYWSSYGELSRELDYSNQTTYPLKIDGDSGTDSSQPLASMVERILHISQEQTPADPDANEVLTTRQDSAGGMSIKTMKSGDSYSGSVSSAVGRPTPRTPKQHTNQGEESSRSSGMGRALSRSDSSRRRRRSRQPSTDNGSSCLDQIESGPLNEDGISNAPGLNIRIAPESVRSSINGANSTRPAQPQRVNYYARHDIQDNATDNNLNVTETPVEFPHTPRPSTRSKSRARRRKTTEVYVTVSDGKIVPYNRSQKQGDDGGSVSTTNEDKHYTVSEHAHYDTTSAVHAPTTTPISTRSPSRSRARRERKLDRASVVRNSINTECGASRERSASRLRLQSSNGHDQNGLNNSVHRERFDPRMSDNCDMTYDSLIGQSDFDSVLKTHNGYTGNQNSAGRSSSFRHTPRKNGSYRAVAW